MTLRRVRLSCLWLRLRGAHGLTQACLRPRLVPWLARETAPGQSEAAAPDWARSGAAGCAVGVAWHTAPADDCAQLLAAREAAGRAAPLSCAAGLAEGQRLAAVPAHTDCSGPPEMSPGALYAQTAGQANRDAVDLAEPPVEVAKLRAVEA
eukprot:scaffold73421_cov49-Prasinocladus_malaysianus.AAC.1